jgi:hypothetical protein
MLQKGFSQTREAKVVKPKLGVNEIQVLALRETKNTEIAEALAYIYGWTRYYHFLFIRKFVEVSGKRYITTRIRPFKEKREEKIITIPNTVQIIGKCCFRVCRTLD